MSSMSLEALFHEHVGPSMAKHLALLKAVEGLPCHVELGRGQVRFLDRYIFQAQLLGIEDQTKEVWTWSWALPESTVAPGVTRSALALKAWGQENGMGFFSVPSFTTENLRGDEIAILSCGLARSDSFLVAGTELGTAYLLIPDFQGQIPVRHPAAFLAEVLPKVLTNYPLSDLRQVVRSLLRFEGYEVDEEDASAWRAHRGDGSRITTRFDGQGRVSQLKVHEEAPARPRSS